VATLDQLTANDGLRLRIRSMSTDDVETVLPIERKLQFHPWRPAHFLDSVRAGKLAVVLETADGPLATMVAYAVVSVGGGEAELLNIGVAPEYQRRGIARRLLEWLIDRIAARADTLFLEVRASNAGAIALYEAMGFNQVGLRPNYYPAAKGREDALIFARTLYED
jgi:ribosomal-protein-alanine N-acetyltransferase